MLFAGLNKYFCQKEVFGVSATGGGQVFKEFEDSSGIYILQLKIFSEIPFLLKLKRT